jgi:hypothetical protein
MSSAMLDDKAYKSRLPDADADLFLRLREPALLEAFAALKDDLRRVVNQVASAKEPD